MLGFSVSEQGPDWSEVDANGVMIGLNGREAAGHGGGGAVISFQPDGDLDAEVAPSQRAKVSSSRVTSATTSGAASPRSATPEGNDLQLYAPPRSSDG